MSNSIDVQNLSIQLVKVFRKKLSQAQLSRRLGFSSNVVTRWEAGKRQISWIEFVELCHIQKFPLEATLYKQLKYDGDVRNIKTFIVHLIGHSSQAKFCKVVGVRPSLVSKWKSGKVIPNTSQIFTIIDSMHGLLLDFVDTLTSPKQLSVFSEQRRQREVQKAALEKYPEAAAFLAAASLSLSAKALDKMWHTLAENLRLQQEVKSEMISSLLDSGWLKKIDGVYKTQTVRLDTRGNHTLAVVLRKYWMLIGSRFLENVSDVIDPHRFANFTVALSEEADKKAADAYHKYILHLKEIVTNDTGTKTRIRSINVQDLWINHA